MPTDRYTRLVLTVIAGALVYLCVVLTPTPVTHAQQAGLRPGDYTGPAEVLIVGSKLSSPLDVRVQGPVDVRGTVTAQQRPDTPDRVVLVGWENQMRQTGTFTTTQGLPTSPVR